MPVYNKPMIYYPLSVLMLSEIREVLIISTPADLPMFQRLLGDGSQFGLSLSYEVQARPEGLAQAFQIGATFLDGHPACLVLGDNLFYGSDLPKLLRTASGQNAGATIFGYRVAKPQDYGVVEFDANGRALSLEEKPQSPKSDFAIPGLYFYDESVVEKAAGLKPSHRGELEITDLNRLYLEAGSLQVEMMGRGTAWLDTGTHESLHEAAEFVRVIEKRQGLMIACLEEIAWRKKWISMDQLQQAVDVHGKSSYARYLEQLAKHSTPFGA